MVQLDLEEGVQRCRALQREGRPTAEFCEQADELQRLLRREFVRKFAEVIDEKVSYRGDGTLAWIGPDGRAWNVCVYLYTSREKEDAVDLYRIAANFDGADYALKHFAEKAGGNLLQRAEQKLELTVGPKELMDFVTWLVEWMRFHVVGARLPRPPHRCRFTSPATDKYGYGWTTRAWKQMNSSRKSP